jgi:hypothetical protein
MANKQEEILILGQKGNGNKNYIEIPLHSIQNGYR